MASTPNTIDYSNLNKNLQPKRKIDWITTDVAKAIWDVFLQSNGFDSRKRDSTKTNKLNQFSDSIEWASEWMKTEFVLAINYLSEHNLIKVGKLKSLKLSSLEDSSKTKDEKLSSILDELTKDLPETDKIKLEQYVNKKLIDSSKESRNSDELWQEIDSLRQENSDLRKELDATDATIEIAESAVLRRRSRNNTIRVWRSIKKIVMDTSLDKETKARKILWQANTFSILGTWKRFDWINKLPRKFDVNKAYNEAVNKLKEKIKNTEDAREKVAIKYIMRKVNNAYKDYVDATMISDETRRQNMQDINMAMAA